MILANKWTNYELMDCGQGQKIERWGDVRLMRPDPQAIWPLSSQYTVDAVYHRNDKGGGAWQKNRSFPKSWTIDYEGKVSRLTFQVHPTDFKHTGLFPEQAPNWDLIASTIAELKQRGETVRVLNLFAYTGAATVAAALAGADEVVHVDASKGMIAQAKQNLSLSGGDHCYVRFICDDVMKFVQREHRRNRQYHIILMDPPAYGRGPNGELWKIEDQICSLIERVAQIFHPDASLMIINSYATQITVSAVKQVVELLVKNKRGGVVSGEELGIPATKRSVILPCGSTVRWQKA